MQTPLNPPVPPLALGLLGSWPPWLLAIRYLLPGSGPRAPAPQLPSSVFPPQAELGAPPLVSMAGSSYFCHNGHHLALKES